MSWPEDQIYLAEGPRPKAGFGLVLARMLTQARDPKGIAGLALMRPAFKGDIERFGSALVVVSDPLVLATFSQLRFVCARA